MGIHAYSELYIEKAQETLAVMLDYAINYEHEDLDKFFAMFIISGIASKFESGSPKHIVGMTGIDLYYLVKGIDIKVEDIKEYNAIKLSKEYWLGYYLAYAQWELNCSFRDITYAISMSEMISMYNPLHEADVTKFVDIIYDRLLKANHNLKVIRERNGLSQSELASLSGVSIRNIQMFEQGNNDIRKAQYNIIKALATSLNCSELDLVMVDDLKQRFISYGYKNDCLEKIKEYIDAFPYLKTAYVKDKYYIDSSNLYENNKKNNVMVDIKKYVDRWLNV